MAECADVRYERTAAEEAFADVCAEIENVRAALDWCATNDACGGVRLAAACEGIWLKLSLSGEGIARSALFESRCGSEIAMADHAQLLGALSNLLSESIRSSQAFETAERALNFARECGQEQVLFRTLVRYGFAAARARRFPEARGALDAAETMDIVAGDALRLDILGARGLVATLEDRVDEAVQAYDANRRLCHAIGNRKREAIATLNLSEIEHIRGMTARAARLAEESLQRAGEDFDRATIAHINTNFAGYLLALDELERARTAASRAIELFAGWDPASPLLAASIEHLALVIALEGDPARAARLLGAADSAIATSGFEREYTERLTDERLRAELSHRLDPQRLAQELASGNRLSIAEAVRETALSSKFGKILI